MNKKYKLFLIISLLILLIIIMSFSYYGIWFFTENFNELDYLILNILGDTILVGIVTHISSKNISTSISKKEFDRNNKINITINKSRTSMINYTEFINAYQNSDIFFSIDKEDREVLDKTYKLYDYVLNTLQCSGVEKQLMDNILNIPFVFNYYEDENVLKCYTDIVDKFDPGKRFGNISILKNILKDNNLTDWEKFSNIVLNFKKYEITNLNSIEGCQLLITADNIVSCKIACLPNHKYTLYAYYNSEHMMNFMAFSFDYDSKEYATNICGIKYTNDDEKIKPTEINLTDFINVK